MDSIHQELEKNSVLNRDMNDELVKKLNRIFYGIESSKNLAANSRIMKIKKHLSEKVNSHCYRKPHKANSKKIGNGLITESLTSADMQKDVRFVGLVFEI